MAAVADVQEIRDIMAQERTAAKAKQRAKPIAVVQASDARIRSVFGMFDSSSSGSVSVDELDLMLKSLGISSSTDPRNQLEAAGLDPTALAVTLSEFTQVVRSASASSTREAERVFDLVADGGDAITFEKLRAALDEADARVSDEELREVIRYCGLSDKSDATISRADWAEVMSFMAELGM